MLAEEAAIVVVEIEAFVIVVGCVGIVGPVVVIRRIEGLFEVLEAEFLGSGLESIIFGCLLEALVAFAYLKI